MTVAQICSRCEKQIGLLGRVGFDTQHQRCRDCASTVRKQLENWRKYFLQACQDGLLTADEWAALTGMLTNHGLAKQEAAAFVRRDALSFVERAFTFAKADGYLDEVEEITLRWIIEELHLDEAASYIVEEVDYLSQVRKVRDGRVPTIKPSVVLPVDELCYLETPASYRKVTKSTVADLPVTLVLTNKRLIVRATTGGGEIALKKVLNATPHTTGIFLELAQQKHNGFYGVAKPLLTAETILAVVRMSTRQLIAPTDGRDTRRIPQHVKMEVWQRDQGHCVECSATEYLEFDHIIPFSKGGATSAGNLQLLCRRCNLAKGDRL